MLGGLEKELGRFGPEERARRERLIGSLASLVLRSSSNDDLREVEEVLAGYPKIGGEGEPTREALEAARARNLVRVMRDRARLRRECLKAGEVEEALGVGRERLRQLRGSGRLLGIAQGDRRPTLYPYWQFSGDGEPVRGLDEVVRAAREAGMGAEKLHFFVTEPNGRIGGERPAELLRRGEAGEVSRLILTSGLGPF